MTNCRSILGTVLLLCCLWPTNLRAQAPETCSYDACALRLHHTFFKTEIVQGHDARPVASLGLFGRRVPLFAERSDTAAAYYASFRRRSTSGTLLGLAGLVVTTLGLVEYDSDHDAGVSLAIVGGLLGIGGGIQVGRAREQLSKAVWWYNRTLTTSP